MVVGPAMDLLSGRDPLQVLAQGNRAVSIHLSLRVKVLFWLTNGPYWALGFSLLVSAPPHLPPDRGPTAMHGLAMLTVAAVSSLFHGAVLSRPAFAPAGQLERLIPFFLAADLTVANAYGLYLAVASGFLLALRFFALPLLLLTASAYTKRRGHIRVYAALHGAWHVLSCAAICRLLYRDGSGQPWPAL